MIEPTSGDILLGRGVRINNHPGNEAYREIISANAGTYAASTKSDKTSMSTKIVTELLNSNPPRRFLEKSETGKWQEVPLKRAATKTSQALRDVALDRAKAAGAVVATKPSTVSSFIIEQQDDNSQQQQNVIPLEGLQQNVSNLPAEHAFGSLGGADSSVDLFLEELSSGLLDNILAASGGADVLGDSDDMSLGVVDRGALADGGGGAMQQEVTLFEWIKSSKMAYSSSHGLGGGGMTSYLESALGIAIKLTDYIIKSDEEKEDSTSGDVERTVVCIKDAVSMVPQEDDTTVVIKCQTPSRDDPGGVGDRLYAVGKILAPLLSGEVGEMMEEAVGNATKTSSLESMNLNSDDDNCPPKKRQQMKPYLPAQLEHLDLPQPVITILSNLLECGQGEFVSDEAYTSFGDLLVDLKLLRTEGLSRFSGCQGVIVTGAGGVGKSRIAAHIFELTRKDGGLVFATKFDQNQDVNLNPLAKIGVIFNDLIDLFVTVASPSTLLSLSNDLENALGIHAALLYEVLPSLPRIMPSCSQVRYHVDQVNMANSMRFMFCKLFEILLSYQTGRITMLFDDVQWADATSLSLLSSLLQSNEGAKRVYFTSCYRDSEVNDSLLAWLQSISGLSLEQIKLESLTPNGVNQFVSESLHLFPRLTRPLSLVLHKKTGGNPLFLGQILSALGGSGRASPLTSSPSTKGGEICFRLSRRRWTWDVEKIEDLELPDDVVSFIVTEMKKLSADLLFGLKVAACIGSRMTSDVIDILSAELTAAFTGTTLADILHKLAQKGFLTKHVCSRKTECCATSSGSGRFEFVHDKIQEAAYEFMSRQEQRLNHIRFGLALYPQAVNNSNDELLFMAINQINFAGPESIVDGDQKYIIAGLNLNAGKRAGKRSDYQTAFSLFQHGMSYLEADCWTNHYGTSIELFDSAAQAAVVVNDLEAVTLYSNTVNSQAKCFDDKLNCISVKLKALIHGERYGEAMGYFLEIVKVFREPALLPMHEMQEDMKAMNSVMKGLADETLLSLSTMKQKKTIALLTVQEGLCSKSPIVFALYAKSLSLSGTSNDIGEGVRFGRLSKTLQERMGSSDCGSLNAMVYYVMGLAQPFQALTEEFKLSKKTGEQSGDIFNAVASYCVICLLSYITGEPLTYVRRKSIDCIIADAESVDDVIFGEKKALAAAGKDNFEALSSYEANQLAKEEEKKWMKVGDTLLEKMECWNKFISWNFQSKMLLLKAEKMYCLGETESAARRRYITRTLWAFSSRDGSSLGSFGILQLVCTVLHKLGCACCRETTGRALRGPVEFDSEGDFASSNFAESELSYNGACYRNGGGWVLVATHGRMATPVEDFMGDEEMEKKFDSQDFLDAEFNRESKILFINTLDRLLSIKILTA
ncbi:putative AAA ATPase [Skeletonema marinoi]|uniref:AAA ATPase n=1 Tax=Skeletonema marinoi TaxID=267567 RepID=A0AAD8XRS1_9STRA|nr:putative AAA ATPase [Skeletonema marinoi]